MYPVMPFPQLSHQLAQASSSCRWPSTFCASSAQRTSKLRIAFSSMLMRDSIKEGCLFPPDGSMRRPTIACSSSASEGWSPSADRAGWELVRSTALRGVRLWYGRYMAAARRAWEKTSVRADELRERMGRSEMKGREGKGPRNYVRGCSASE